MLVEKIFTVTVNIQDANNYLSNPETILNSILRRRFIGKCYQSVFIIDILEIIERAPCRIQRTNLSAHGFVDVQFKAEVSIVMPGDILNNVTIYDSNSKFIRGESNTDGSASVVVMGKDSNITGVVRKDQIISIRVKQMDYSPNRDKFTAIGIPVTCEKSVILYNVTGKMDKRMYRHLQPICKNIEDMLQTRENLMKLNSNALIRMESVIYTYSTFANDKIHKVDNWSGPTTSANYMFETRNILKILKDNNPEYDFSGIWGRDLSIVKSSPLVAMYNQSETEKMLVDSTDVEIVESKPETMIIGMIKSIYNYLKYINENAVTFSKQSVFDEHKNIWLTMKQSQISN
jgi:hypothetical protein